MFHRLLTMNKVVNIRRFFSSSVCRLPAMADSTRLDCNSTAQQLFDDRQQKL